MILPEVRKALGEAFLLLIGHGRNLLRRKYPRDESVSERRETSEGAT
jgi:hypothetical protein